MMNLRTCHIICGKTWIIHRKTYLWKYGSQLLHKLWWWSLFYRERHIRLLLLWTLEQRRPTQIRPRAAFSKNRLMKGRIFRKFQSFCWFFSKRTISRKSWRAAEKSFKGRLRPAGRGLADPALEGPIQLPVTCQF
jgi:hypothetical protein